MSGYRRIERRMWADLKFRSLSAPQPNAQSLWIWLITGPRSYVIPGVVIGREAELAAAIGWPLEGFRKAFAEVSRKAMAKADFEAGLVWLPKGPAHQPPQSPNVLRSWAKGWDLVPECRLKLEVYQEVKDFSEGLGKAFAEAFVEAFAIPLPNQEQDQEQEEDPVAKKLPPDSSPAQALDEVIWGHGVRWLTSNGTSESQARSFLGKLRKDIGDDELIAGAIFRGLREKPIEPKAWLKAAVTPRKRGFVP